MSDQTERALPARPESPEYVALPVMTAIVAIITVGFMVLLGFAVGGGDAIMAVVLTLWVILLAVAMVWAIRVLRRQVLALAGYCLALEQHIADMEAEVQPSEPPASAS